MTHQKSCEIIAEAGVNHNGNVDTAKEMIRQSQISGADVIKFQTFNPDELVSEDTEKAGYQQRSEDQNQYEMLNRLTLTRQEHKRLIKYCKECNIEFMSTAYDVNSVQLLESIGVERYKIASADIVNKPLLKSVAETNKPVILSTGMATLGEIERAVNFLNGSGCNDLTLFHCISCYPAEPEQINLKFMKTLNKAFDVPVGFSDHTLETCIPAVAASHGAVAVEKHFTLDRDMKGPDHLASLEPAELSKMVNKIRDVESAMGSASQATVDQEEKNATLMRRSLHSRRPLSPGETIDREDIKIVRPSNGIDPWSIDDVVGSELKEGIDSDEAINWSSLHRY